MACDSVARALSIVALGEGGGSTPESYTTLTDKPMINSVELNGNKTLSQLGIDIPTHTSQLTNNSGFITSAYHDSTKQDNLTAGANISISGTTISASHPANYIKNASASGNVLTLVKQDDTTVTFEPDGQPDAFLKSASVSGNTLTITKKDDTTVVFTPEQISAYIKSAAVSGDTLTLTKQDDSTVTFTNTDTTYTAGSNVSISSGNVISATDTTYTAGANVSISGTVISATDTKYTAGTNVTINSSNVISAADTTYTAGTGINIDGSNVISCTVSPGATYTAGTGISIDTSNVIAADTAVLATKTYVQGIFSYDSATSTLTITV